MYIYVCTSLQHFVSALSDTNDVPMKPLILPKQVLDELFGYESVPKGGLKGCREGTAAAKELSKQRCISYVYMYMCT